MGLTATGGRLNIKCRLTSIRIPMLKIRRSRDRLIFNMGIHITRKDGLYIETGPRCQLTMALYISEWRHVYHDEI